MAVQSIQRYFPFLLLLLFTLGETLCNSLWLLNPPFNSVYVTSLIYFVCGIAISILPFFRPGYSVNPVFSENRFALNISLRVLFFLLLSGYLIHRSWLQFQTMPIDYKIADMLPIIKTMCARLLNGEQVYAPIAEIWGGIKPIYLPFMWMPFIPAEYFGFDLRWTNVIFILGGILAIMKIPNFRRIHPILFAISMLPIVILVEAMLRHKVISITEEGIIYGYYMFLGYALAKNNYVLIAITITMCLFSRYSLVLWIPAYLVFVYFFNSKRLSLITLMIIGLITLMVFIIPFYDNIGFFLSMHNDYIEGAKNLWKFQPEHVMNSLGLAKFFSIHHIPLIHTLLITFAILIPSLSLAAYSLLRKKFNLDSQFFGLCSLKLSLVFFYNWLENPYLYLFFTSTFFSYCILCKYADVYARQKPMIS